MLVDATLVDRAAAYLDVVGDLGAMRFVGVSDASPDAMIDVMRSRLLDDQAGRGTQRSYRYVSIFPPGYIPGDMPFLAGEASRLIYGDEDVMDIDGSRSRPYFKPDFRPGSSAAFRLCVAGNDHDDRACPEAAGPHDRRLP